mmetsp:Transcript_25349/g.71088  ORF Transcript_25349/g.71088 Transcript_25349/m.71088 type:complete len:274 (-) Transcript_25349:780-1601(-)
MPCSEADVWIPVIINVPKSSRRTCKVPLLAVELCDTLQCEQGRERFVATLPPVNQVAPPYPPRANEDVLHPIRVHIPAGSHSVTESQFLLVSRNDRTEVHPVQLEQIRNEGPRTVRTVHEDHRAGILDSEVVILLCSHHHIRQPISIDISNRRQGAPQEGGVPPRGHDNVTAALLKVQDIDGRLRGGRSPVQNKERSRVADSSRVYGTGSRDDHLPEAVAIHIRRNCNAVPEDTPLLAKSADRESDTSHNVRVRVRIFEEPATVHHINDASII